MNSSVPPQSLPLALDHVRNGGKLMVRTYTRITIIDAKTLARFEKAGEWLIKEDGDSYRMRKGRGSVYLFRGQLEFA
jgi:hypothetical protein